MQLPFMSLGNRAAIENFEQYLAGGFAAIL